MLGNVTEGAAETVYGTWASDRVKSQGFDKAVDSEATDAKGVVNGVVRTAGSRAIATIKEAFRCH